MISSVSKRVTYLNIETGRRLNIAKHLRFCSLCNTCEIGDEFHVLMKCTNFEAEILKIFKKNYRKTFISGIPYAKKVHHDIAMTLGQQSHDITSTCPTIRMMSLRIPDDTDATEEI
jgi:hypothetical protein